MRIAIAGASGLVGRALVEELTRRGVRVARLVRRPATADDEVSWDPVEGTVDEAALGALTAIVNLAGAPIGERWTPEYKEELRMSRVLSTRTLAKLIARRGCAIDLINASAVGFYGDRPGEALTEASPRGDGFLARLVGDWESATAIAERAGARVVKVRTGIVLAPDGGAVAKMLPLIRKGLGGPLGSGKQIWPWITLPDAVSALCHLLTSNVRGPVNLAAPADDSQAAVVKALAKAFGMPAFVPAPRPALRLAIGEFADEILASQHVVPQALEASGFSFEHPDLTSASTWLAKDVLAREAAEAAHASENS